MKVSLHTIRQFIDFELPPIDQLVANINTQLGGVEEVIDLGAKYKDAKIVRVVECEKHANADKLSVCKIDAGTGELIQVVCGAPNVHSDMWAIWLPPKSIVPATFGDDEPFVLSARDIRGVTSNGMLASARELAIGDDHDGIVEIKEDDLPEGKVLCEGVSFARIFGLDDFVVDIENKMFTHRPDLFGQIGVAREIAGILGKKFSSPDWYTTLPKFTTVSELPLEVFNDTPQYAPRLMAVVLKDIEVKQSPLWLRCALVAMGGKPINTVVDATNYVMFMTAQPTHAYDYDKIRGHKIGVRMARDGEAITLLNKKTYTLSKNDIVIADGEGAIGLAGIMGGGNSEVSSETKNIILEVANFDMYTLRKSSMEHGLFTDALTRFNKGQSPYQNPYVINMLMENIISISDGSQASDVFDLGMDKTDSSTIYKTESLGVSADFINTRVGLTLGNNEIKDLLENVEFKVDNNNEELSINSPYWRQDIHLPEDIVEEVGRLYGYNRMPLELPTRSTKPTPRNEQREFKQMLRSLLARSGANEVLTYSFVHERILNNALQNKNDAYQISNALSPDLQYYRLSITPSLLDKIHGNIKSGHDDFAIFEIGKAHGKQLGMDDENLPVESSHVAFVYANKQHESSSPFYMAKTYLEFLAHRLGISLDYEQLGKESTSPLVAPFEPKRSAIVTEKVSGEFIGIIGEFKYSVVENFKLPMNTAGFELNINTLLATASDVAAKYRPLSRYPSSDRDISIRVNESTHYKQVREALESALGSINIDYHIEPISIYQPDNTDMKTFTFRLSFSSYEKTLTSEEVNTFINQAADTLSATIGAEIV